MAQMSELPSRTFSEMKELLDELNSSLEGRTPPGVRYTFFAVGGIAMGAVFNERTTQDIDLIDAGIPESVRKAVRLVAKRRRMSDQWLNNQVSEMVDVDLPFGAFQTIYSNRNLHVYGAKPEYLLALKLMSGRGKDIPDIILLGKEVGARSSASLLAAWDHVYDTSASYSVERGFVSSLCDDVAPLLQ